MPYLTLGLTLKERGGVSYGMCFMSVVKDGDWYGSSEPASEGEIEPGQASDGTDIYSYRVNATTGEFRLRFGSSGNEQLNNCSLVIYDHGSFKVGMEWDSTNEYYSGTDYDAAQIVAGYKGSKHCFNSYIVPELLIHYDFSDLEASI